jgi:hypothetical protein
VTCAHIKHDCETWSPAFRDIMAAGMRTARFCLEPT